MKILNENSVVEDGNRKIYTKDAQIRLGTIAGNQLHRVIKRAQKPITHIITPKVEEGGDWRAFFFFNLLFFLLKKLQFFNILQIFGPLIFQAIDSM